MDARQIAIIVLASLAWVLSAGVLIARLCQRYPGVRTLCRYVFLGELAVSFLLGVAGSVIMRYLSGAGVLTLVKLAFAIALLTHATLYALFLNWLLLRELPPTGLRTERELIDLLGALAAVPRKVSKAG